MEYVLFAAFAHRQNFKSCASFCVNALLFKIDRRLIFNRNGDLPAHAYQSVFTFLVMQ